MSSNSEARKRGEETPPAMRREAERLEVEGRILRALQRVYFGATWLEATGLRDALEDEGLLT